MKRAGTITALAVCLFTVCAFGGAVTLSEDASEFTLANGLFTAKINKRTGDLVSLRYQGLEMLGHTSGHPRGYWSHSPARMRETNTVTIDPARNGGVRGEVSVKGFYDASENSGNSGGTAADIEIRYTLERDDTGLYTYSIFTHPSNYPGTSIGEARFAAKLNPAVFDYMTIDSRRRRLMPKPADWDDGTELNMKEARRLNTGIYKGQVEHKYDYSAIQFDIPAFGWSGAKDQVGLWFVNPSIEYLSGGATKVELTGHLDDNQGAAPTLLNYWRGSHYGGSSCVMAAGEAWTKVIGPFLIYCNQGADPDHQWQDALRRAKAEAAAWPYHWVAGADYPHKSERAPVSGKILLTDPISPGLQISNVLAGLAAPDCVPRGRSSFGDPRTVDWQMDAKFYQFWTRADDEGRFVMPNVRPGVYTLHIIADGVPGEFTHSNVVVTAGGKVELGDLRWTPEHFGRPLWQIGIPNRSAEEFRHGDHYWQWGLYNLYTNEFPNDVNFIVGQSDIRQDWNYAQVPRDNEHGSVWTIRFPFDGAPGGRATLRLGLAAASERGGVKVIVNGQPAGGTGPLMDTATIRRDGIRGYWVERDVAFNAALLHAGQNTLQLAIPGGNQMSGIEYDFVRLEWDATASPP